MPDKPGRAHRRICLLFLQKLLTNRVPTERVNVSSYLDRTIDWMGLARRANYRAKELARVKQISVRQLERHFVDSFGRRPQHWLDELRLMDAVVLLIEGYRVKEVAAKLEFSDVAHFSHRFKDHFGCSPSDFLKVYQQRLVDRKKQFEDWCPGEPIPPDWLVDPLLVNGHANLYQHVQPFPVRGHSNPRWQHQVAA